MNIIIQPIELSDIKNNPNKYNTNNHWDNDIKPIDYYDVIYSNSTCKWIDDFRESYKIINIQLNDNEKKMFLLGHKISKTMGNISKLLEEDLDYFYEKYKHLDNLFDKENGNFIRSEHCSLKTGKYGIGPYFNIKQVIISFITSIPGHSPMDELYNNNYKIKLYLFDWLNINNTFDKLKEFRVFVYKNKITCISQQDLYIKNNLLSNLNESDSKIIIIKWCEILVNYINQIKKPFNCSIDIAILSNEKPYLFEFNCFGKQYSAGSSLFNWLIDEKIMLSNGEKIYFRYTI